MASARILLLEDERETALALAEFLTLKGMTVYTAFDGIAARRLVDEHAATLDAAVLDVMVPGLDGHAICRYIKDHPAAGDLPVLFLTARDREEDQISGLQLGADAYLTKPAGLNLIATHIASLLKRFPRKNAGWLKAGPVMLNEQTRELVVQGVRADVTPTEFDLMRLFMHQPRRVFDRAEILDLVFGNDKDVFDRTVDVHVKNLRLKLGPAGDLIRTVRGVGYGLAPV